MNKLLGIFAGVTLLAAVGTVAYWAGSRNATPPGPPSSPSPTPPTPIKVPDTPTVSAQERIRQTLRPGFTYQTHLKGTIRGPAENKQWAIKTVVDVLYSFEAFIDREIVSNDGTTVVEVRRFKSIKSLDVHGKLKDVRIDLGPPGKVLFFGLALIDPAAAAAVRHFDGLSLAPVLRWLEHLSIEKIIGLDARLMEAFSKADALTGKVVRMEYVDGKGVLDVRDVAGVATPEERAFHNATILCSDALLFPDTEVRVGGTWEVDGRAFNHLIDPSLRATLSGRVKFVRLADEERSGKKLRVLSVVKPARFEMEASDKDEGRIGHVEPEGKLYFSPEERVIVEGELGGSGVLHRFTKTHLLFETAFRGKPNLEAKYFCRVVKTEAAPGAGKGGQP